MQSGNDQAKIICLPHNSWEGKLPLKKNQGSTLGIIRSEEITVVTPEKWPLRLIHTVRVVDQTCE